MLWDIVIGHTESPKWCNCIKTWSTLIKYRRREDSSLFFSSYVMKIVLFHMIIAIIIIIVLAMITIIINRFSDFYETFKYFFLSISESSRHICYLLLSPSRVRQCGKSSPVEQWYKLKAKVGVRRYSTKLPQMKARWRFCARRYLYNPLKTKNLWAYQWLKLLSVIKKYLS